jgi:hypothetical protein
MKKFTVEVIRTDEYEIEIDETLYNEAWQEEFGKFMWPLDGLKDIARDIAWHQMRNGNDRFLEGYGNITRDGSLPFDFRDFDENGDLKPEDQRANPAPGLNINVITEDDEYEFNIEEVEA